MKKLIMTLVVLPVILGFTSFQSNAQWTGHLFGNFQIEDPSWQQGDQYQVAFKLLYGSSFTGWTIWGTTPTVGAPVTFTDVHVTDFDVPTPIPYNYYAIAIIVYKNQDPNIFGYNSSYSGTTLLSVYNMRFDAVSSPIEVKIP